MKKKYLALALTAFLCSHSYAQDSNAKEICLSAQQGLEDINTFEHPTCIQDVETSIKVEGITFKYVVKPYTFAILRLKVE